MKAFVLFLTFGIFGSAKYPSEHVDCIELNHHYDQKGRILFDQAIFWEITPATGKFHVRGWAMCDQDNVYPIRIGELVRFENAEIRVHSRLFRESWTQTDPERADNKVHPMSLRIAIPKKYYTKRATHDENQAPG